MLTLLSECHFWSVRDEVRIKSMDFGAFRYIRNRELQQQTNTLETGTLAKRDYITRRNGIAVLKSNRNLKDNLKKLEEFMRTHTIVYSRWKDSTTQLKIMFANGIIAHICIDIYTGDILRMVFDKYLVGKLAAEDTLTDAIFTRSHIVLTYRHNQLTVVHLQNQNHNDPTKGPVKISNMDPRIFHVIIPGPSERKLARHISVNCGFDLFVIWTKSSQNEVYPWRPTIRDQDRANIHVFKLKGSKLESISYCWSENDPLCVDFLRSTESQVLTVEQKISSKGETSAEICSYEISSGKMQRTLLTSIAVGTQICSFAFSPDQEKLFLGTIDRNIYLHDLVLQTTKFLTQIDIIPTQSTWHCDSSIIMIANDRSQFQCFDLALTPICNQLQSEDVTPHNLLDLSHYFTVQPTLQNISFSSKPDLANFPYGYAQTDCFLLLIFANGPIGCLRFIAGAGIHGDIHNSGLTTDVIIDKYLAINQLDKAVNLLIALNWETYGAMCLISLHKIANFVFYRSDTKRTHIELMVKAFKTFTDTNLSEDTKDEFSDQVFDLKRRFFFFLLRKNLFAEAFEVAQDIEDYDLFMDLFNITKSNSNLNHFSTASFSQAATILHNENRPNGNLSLAADGRSEYECSESTSSDTLVVSANKNNNNLKNYVPPLPSLKSKIFSAEMIQINIPKPELRVDTKPPLPDVRQLKIKSSNRSNDVFSATKGVSNNNTSYRTKNFNDNYTTDVTAISTNFNWQEVPSQNIGIPSYSNTSTNLYVSSISQNLLPRASRTNAVTSSNATIFNTSHSVSSKRNSTQEQINALHYAEHHNSLLSSSITIAAATTQKCYQLYQPKFYQHPLVSGTIPQTVAANSNDKHEKHLTLKKPSASILSNSGTTQQNNHLSVAGGANLLVNTLQNINNVNNNNNKELGSGKNVGGERNKVKFSDTVQVAVVPDITRKEKILPPKRNGYGRLTPRNLMNPKKELADSLPLCHPNDDYLKDFNPISAEITARSKSDTKDRQSSNKVGSTPSSIKVVHFGVV